MHTIKNIHQATGMPCPVLNILGNKNTINKETKGGDSINKPSSARE
jgi:hypothetical protein